MVDLPEPVFNFGAMHLRYILENLWSEHGKKAVWVIGMTGVVPAWCVLAGALSKAGDSGQGSNDRRNETLNTYLTAGPSATPQMLADYEAAYRAHRALVPNLAAEMGEAATVVVVKSQTQVMSRGVTASK